MRITKNARSSLEFGFIYHKLTPNRDVVDEENLRPTPKYSENKAVYDEVGNLIGIPRAKHPSRSTQVKRPADNNRIVTGIEAGKILSAALNQPRLYAHFLQFVYDPECPVSVQKRVVDYTTRQITSMIPHRASPTKRAAFIELVQPILLDFAYRMRNDGEPLFQPLNYARFIGYQNIVAAHWWRDYDPLFQTIINWLVDIDRQAIIPVQEVVNGLFTGCCVKN